VLRATSEWEQGIGEEDPVWTASLLQLGTSIESSFYFLTTNQSNLRSQISMGLSKGILYAGLAFAVCALGTPAKAGTVVFSDQSTDGTAVVTGVTGGATVVSSGATITSLNGAPFTTPTLTLGIAEHITSYTPIGGGMYLITGTGTKIITDPAGDSVKLELALTSGVAMTGSFVTEGLIIGALNVGGDGLPDGYNFGTLVGGVTTISINDAGVPFGSYLGNPGAGSTAPAPVTVTETAVPEPTTMALLGIGMAGFFTYRRLFKRAIAA
jgi:hypothetical protein